MFPSTDRAMVDSTKFTQANHVPLAVIARCWKGAWRALRPRQWPTWQGAVWIWSSTSRCLGLPAVDGLASLGKEVLV